MLAEEDPRSAFASSLSDTSGVLISAMKTKPKEPANNIETGAGLNRFDIAVLRDVAGEKVFARGAAYHEDEHVEIVMIDRTRVLARVIGSEVYRCELVGMGKKFSGECSCRAFSDWGFCKHLVATALTANSLGSGALEQASSRFAKIRDHLRAKGVEGPRVLSGGLAAEGLHQPHRLPRLLERRIGAGGEEPRQLTVIVGGGRCQPTRFPQRGDGLINRHQH